MQGYSLLKRKLAGDLNDDEQDDEGSSSDGTAKAAALELSLLAARKRYASMGPTALAAQVRRRGFCLNGTGQERPYLVELLAHDDISTLGDIEAEEKRAIRAAKMFTTWRRMCDGIQKLAAETRDTSKDAAETRVTMEDAEKKRVTYEDAEEKRASLHDAEESHTTLEGAEENCATLHGAEENRATLEGSGENRATLGNEGGKKSSVTAVAAIFRRSWYEDSDDSDEEAAEEDHFVSAPTAGQNEYCSAYSALAKFMVLAGETSGVEEAVKRGVGLLNKSAGKEVFKLANGAIELKKGFGWTVNPLFKGGKQHGELRAIKDALSV